MAKRKSKYYVRPDGLHECIKIIDGKRKAFRGKTDAEVERKMIEYQQTLDTIALGRTFKEVAEEWEETHFSEIAEGTKMSYRPALKRVKQEFGDMLIKDLKPLQIKDYLVRFGKLGYSSHTASVELTVINLICINGILHQDIAVNPAAEVKIPRKLPRKKREKATDEQEAIILSNYNLPFGLMPLLLLCIGPRLGEALALDFRDIDRKAKRASINKKIIWVNNRPVLQDYTKTPAGERSMVIPDILLNALPKKKSGLIFQGANGYMTEHEFRNAWLRYCKATGMVTVEAIYYKDKKGKDRMRHKYHPAVTPHNLRHSYATMLHEAKIDVKEASGQMGHSKVAVTQDIYTSITKSALADSALKLDAYITKKISDTNAQPQISTQ